MTTLTVRITPQDGEFAVDAQGRITLRADVIELIPRALADRPEPPQDAAEHLARARDRSDAEEAAEEWFREAEPQPFTPDQRAWILRRIERAIETARLNDGADSAADHFWPEVPAGEIDF